MKTTIYQFKRLEAILRSLIFESLKRIGIFYLVTKTPGLKLKEPWNRLYNRRLKTNRY